MLDLIEMTLIRSGIVNVHVARMDGRSYTTAAFYRNKNSASKQMHITQNKKSVLFRVEQKEWISLKIHSKNTR